MSRSTISTFQLSEMFPNEETARQFLEANRWPKGTVCPVCKEDKRVTPRKDGYYRCLACVETFTVRTKTIFERSHVPLHKWLHAMYRLMTARKGISSLQLAKEIGVTQKTAWFMLHRMREACKGDLTKLKGIVEMDETFIGGLERNKHREKQLLGASGGRTGKAVVVGMRERGGRVKAHTIQNTNTETLMAAIQTNIEPGAMVHTDEWIPYRAISKFQYGHESINHKSGEYNRKGVHTNGIESVWAVLKRGIHGVYHHVDSTKHLGRYVSEFTFRLNEGDVKRHTMDRMESLIAASFGKRLTYKDLIKN